MANLIMAAHNLYILLTAGPKPGKRRVVVMLMTKT